MVSDLSFDLDETKITVVSQVSEDGHHFFDINIVHETTLPFVQYPYKQPLTELCKILNVPFARYKFVFPDGSEQYTPILCIASDDKNRLH